MEQQQTLADLAAANGRKEGAEMTESKILTGMRQAVEHAKGHPFAAAAAVFATVDAAEDEEAEGRAVLDALAQDIAGEIAGCSPLPTKENAE